MQFGLALPSISFVERRVPDVFNPKGMHNTFVRLPDVVDFFYFGIPLISVYSEMFYLLAIAASLLADAASASILSCKNMLA